MITIIRKRGNGLVVKLPRKMAEQNGLREGTKVTIASGGGATTIRAAVHERRASLKSLLAKIKPGQRQGEWNNSRPQGNEFI